MPQRQTVGYADRGAAPTTAPVHYGAAYADDYTRWHCTRVADAATELARDAGLTDEQLVWFRTGALLHDIGKLHIPKAILEKPGALTPEEMEVVQQHPVVGVAMVAQLPLPWDVRPMVRHHHERWDGTGYPDRLARKSIPKTARILCIADVYDAMTHERPYHPAHTPDEAMLLMRAERGRMFDPELLDLFLSRTLPRLRFAVAGHVCSTAQRSAHRIHKTPLELRTLDCQA
jgi:putative nucleotidyltransferase with HDIG domain